MQAAQCLREQFSKAWLKVALCVRNTHHRSLVSSLDGLVPECVEVLTKLPVILLFEFLFLMQQAITSP